MIIFQIHNTHGDIKVLFHYHSMGPWRCQMAPGGSSPHPLSIPPSFKRLQPELQSTQSRPSSLIGAADRGVKGRDPRGSAARSPGCYIMFIRMKGQASICARSSCRTTLILATFWPLRISPGSRASEASPGSDMSEGHNSSQIKAAEAPLPGAWDAMGHPLTSLPPRRVKK